MEPYDVNFLQEALDDLEEIVLYIAKNSKAAAFRVHDEFMKKASELKNFPKRGRPVPDKKMSAAGYRMLFVKPYIAFYRIVGSDIFIYRIMHGASNYPTLYKQMLEDSYLCSADEGGIN